VHLIERLGGIKDDPGEKGKSDVLTLMATREAFLRDPCPSDLPSRHAQASTSG
jgi:hypothetical protein